MHHNCDGARCRTPTWRCRQLSTCYMVRHTPNAAPTMAWYIPGRERLGGTSQRNRKTRALSSGSPRGCVPCTDGCNPEHNRTRPYQRGRPFARRGSCTGTWFQLGSGRVGIILVDYSNRIALAFPRSDPALCSEVEQHGSAWRQRSVLDWSDRAKTSW